MPALWYAMRSKPCKEDFLYGQLRAREIECFYPRTVARARDPRSRKVRPYFPGYLFIHADVEQVGMSTLQWMPGAAGVVAFGGQPAWVPENLVNALRRKLEAIHKDGAHPLRGLQPGDPVVINEGPFAGYQAVFDARLSGEERVRVLLSLLNRPKLPLELPGAYLAPQNRS